MHPVLQKKVQGFLPRFPDKCTAPIPTPISFVLQAAAASRIRGKPDIFEAAKSGELSLVRDHVTADPSCVGRRDDTK